MTAHPHPTAPALEPAEDPAPAAPPVPPLRLGRWAVVLVILAVTLFQTTNATAVSFLTIYSVETLQLEALWGGLALGLIVMEAVRRSSRQPQHGPVGA